MRFKHSYNYFIKTAFVALKRLSNKYFTEAGFIVLNKIKSNIKKYCLFNILRYIGAGIWEVGGVGECLALRLRIGYTE